MRTRPGERIGEPLEPRGTLTPEESRRGLSAKRAERAALRERAQRLGIITD